MSVRLRVDKLAADDLSESASWYRNHSEDRDLVFLAAVEGAFDRIREFPGTHERLRPDIYRVLVAKFPFAVVYRFDKSSVEIVAVYHFGRRSRVWRNRV
ncbi:MAG TPA: type II toxin-antitoxin system RelE/ParE family toxin [Caulifigura sp.]|nr:type II toxin-antitoxin system RelE/ParE family toxin [Caulifigura sp.]